MHDIRWIRDNPEAFDRGLARRGLAPEAARLIAIDERRRAPSSRPSRPRPAQRGIEGNRRGQEGEGRAACPGPDGRGRRTEGINPGAGGEEKAASQELDEALAQIPNLPLDEVPDGADEHGNVEHHRFGA